MFIFNLAPVLEEVVDERSSPVPLFSFSGSIGATKMTIAHGYDMTMKKINNMGVICPL